MSKKANPAVVGGFVLGALALLLTGVVMLGGISMFNENLECVAYFDESISGLDIGAPVDFQGVRVGTVTGVSLEFDPHTGEAFRPVSFILENKRIRYVGADFQSRMQGEVLDFLVQRGLRAQLANQSMLTGKLKIELDNFPDLPVTRKNRGGDAWEMPTVPSPLRRVTKQLSDLPIVEIVEDAHAVVRGLAALVQSAQTNGLAGTLNDTLAQLGDTLGALNGRLDPLMTQSGEMMSAATGTLVEMKDVLDGIEAGLTPFLEDLSSTMDQVDAMLDPASTERGEVAALLEEVRGASRSLRLLLDYVEQHPDAWLRGKEP